jgi:2-polyprenyl-6-methoxyphenol hydroxylase-like FAD-dependent oxidoreductase
MDTQQGANRAIIIGGSIAGLLSASVLASYFRQVTILERDTLTETIENRKGVPQGYHAHALLGQGHQIMEELFPGLAQALIRQGAALGDGRFFSGGGYFARHPQAPDKLYVSRACLETELRRRTLQIPNVALVQACDVLGLTATPDRRRITGVRLIRRQAGSAAEILSADLIIDASGRGSRTPIWLEALGYDKPEVSIVEVNMGYASRLYERKPEHLNGDLMVNVAPTPERPIACGMLAQEGNTWLVTLAGYFGDYPPIDEAGFLAFARRLPTADVYDVISIARPLSAPVPFRFPSNQRRHYETLSRFPEGMLVIGDAICSFTPIYGQGMSTAAMEVVVLRECLAAGSKDLAPRFFKQAARVIDIPWTLTVGNDRRLSGAKQPAPKRIINWYMGKLQRAARQDPELALAFQKVTNLFAAPSSLLHPRLAWRVLRGNLTLDTGKIAYPVQQMPINPRQ